MKKLLGISLIVFAGAFAFGSSAVAKPPKGGGGNCYYMCDCTGTPLRCCVSNGVTTCTLTGDIYCLAIITC